MDGRMEGEPKRFCRKCLLRDMPEEAYFESLRKYIDGLDEDLKVPADIYEKRLTCCRSCSHLLSGMCRICGCYVELRAAVRKNACPDVHPAWGREASEERW